MAIIPARGGSKGVPSKNKLPIGGVPLIVRAINACKDSNVVDNIYVSTDDPEIKEISENENVVVPGLRPDILSDDHADIVPVIDHALNGAERYFGKTFSTLVFTDPTTPFRTGKIIRDAYSHYRQGGYESVISVCPLERKPENIFIKTDRNDLERLLDDPKVRHTRRQDMEKLCRLGNAVYVTSPEAWRKNRTLISRPIGYVDINAIEAFTIDEELDYFLAEQISLRYGV
ncbi:cytidylyltransferase domain-containing protein [Thalassospira sp. MCCC 1A01148]|uniref:acylneuraminate cytidylyltransferase family protein n=1 Tax=Thalassospira sp. MCCC 1A01148 TaxID=501834 RepID=UPI0018DC330C|nr:acylneuraminate cytidylyltransferase family protein [Thalassospira sp. MCCC 1A01148]